MAATTVAAPCTESASGITIGQSSVSAAPAAGETLAMLIRELDTAAKLHTTNAALEAKLAAAQKLLAETEAHYNADLPKLEATLSSERAEHKTQLAAHETKLAAAIAEKEALEKKIATVMARVRVLMELAEKPI